MLPAIFGPENKARCIEELKKLKRYLLFRKPTAAAAVLIPLCIVQNMPAIMFLRRTMHLRTHPGEIGFPGGKCDPEDQGDKIRTALRETEEEIGLPPESIDVWHQLPRMDGKSSLYPVLGFCGHVTVPGDHPVSSTTSTEISSLPLGSRDRPHQLQWNNNEVSYVLFRSIDWLCNPNNLTHTTIRTRSTYFMQPTGNRSPESDLVGRDLPPHQQRCYVLPAYGNLARTGSQGPRIWGLTAIMTYQVLHCLIPNGPYPLDHPTVKLLTPMIRSGVAVPIKSC